MLVQGPCCLGRLDGEGLDAWSEGEGHESVPIEWPPYPLLHLLLLGRGGAYRLAPWPRSAVDLFLYGLETRHVHLGHRPLLTKAAIDKVCMQDRVRSGEREGGGKGSSQELLLCKRVVHAAADQLLLLEHGVLDALAVFLVLRAEGSVWAMLSSAVQSAKLTSSRSIWRLRREFTHHR